MALRTLDQIENTNISKQIDISVISEFVEKDGTNFTEYKVAKISCSQNKAQFIIDDNSLQTVVNAFFQIALFGSFVSYI